MSNKLRKIWRRLIPSRLDSSLSARMIESRWEASKLMERGLCVSRATPLSTSLSPVKLNAMALLSLDLLSGQALSLYSRMASRLPSTWEMLSSLQTRCVLSL